MNAYNISSLEQYFQVYRASVEQPEAFWEAIAEEHFEWHKKWDRVLDWDFSTPRSNGFQEPN